MAQKGRGAELKAGLAVVFGLFVLGASVFLVSGGFELFRAKRTITVRFTDAGGVTDGTPVFVAGRKRGNVLQLRDVVVPGEDGRPTDVIDVVVEIDRGVRLYLDSYVTVSRTVTNQVQMNINPGEDRELAPVDHVFEGRPLATFEQTIDSAAGLLNDAARILETVERAVVRLEGQMAELDLATLQGRATDLFDSLNRSAGTVEQILADSREPLQATVQDLRKAAAQAESLTAGLDRGWADLDPEVRGLVSDSRETLAAYRALAEDNREAVRALVQSLNDVVRRMPDVMASAETLLHELRGTMVEARPHAVETLRNAREAMEGFSAVVADLKASPWKLVNKPSGSEVKFVALQESARLYVEAIARIQREVDALEALQRLAAAEGGSAAPEGVQKVLEQLEAALVEQEKRRAALNDLLLEQAK